MEGSSNSIGLPCPVRSISLPSRLHPNDLKIEAELNKLKIWEKMFNSRTTPVNAETIQAGILGLAQIYTCVQELMQSPKTEQALLQHQHGTIADEALEQSLEFLDSCSSLRNLLCMIKEQVQDLESALRRKGTCSSIESDISNYFIFRKKVIKKETLKILKRLKHMENRLRSSNLLDIDQDYLSMVIRVLREVNAVTLSVFKALIVFLSCSDTKTKQSGWTLIHKLMLTKSESSQCGHIFSHMGFVDIALSSLLEQIKSNDANIDVEIARRRLQILDAMMESFEAGLESLYKQLIQNRVSLLNILTH